MAVVLRPFNFAPDGFTVERLVEGDEREFGDLTEGLQSAGYIGADDAAPVLEGGEDNQHTKKRGK